MDVLEPGRRLWVLRAWVAAALAFSFGLGFAVTYNVSFFPPRLEGTGVSTGAGSAAVLVDSEESLLTSLNADFSSLASRAVIIAEFGQSETIQHRVEALAGLPQNSTASAAVTGVGTLGSGGTPPTFRRTATPQVTYVADGASPIITITTTGPSGDIALRLAKAAQQALIEYTKRRTATPLDRPSNAAGQTALQRQQVRQLEALSTVTLRSVRSPEGAAFPPPHTSPKKAIEIGIGLFVLLCLALLLWDNIRHRETVRPSAAAPEATGTRGDHLADNAA